MRPGWLGETKLIPWRAAIENEKHLVSIPSREVGDLAIVITTALSFLIVTLMTAVL